MPDEKVTRKFLICCYSLPLLFSLFVFCGPLGYGIDVHASYQKAESWFNYMEPLGWVLARQSITIGPQKYFIGGTITAFILSSGLLFLSLTILTPRLGYLFTLSTYCLLLFTHPIILSSTNVLRQGIGMGFLYFALGCFVKRRVLLGVICLICAILSHKSIVLLSPILLIYYLFPKSIVRSILICIAWLSVVSLIQFHEYKIYPTGINYFPIAIILFVTAFFCFNILFERYRHHVLYVQERYLLNYIVLNTLSIIFMAKYPILMQRLLMILMIPMYFYIFIVIPIDKTSKKILMFLITIAWVIVTLLSPALRTWEPL